jgi:hypothetical protein
MARILAWSSIVAVVVFGAMTVLIAFLNVHESTGVTMFMAYAALSWAYAVLTFTGPREPPGNEDLHEELARRIGFLSYERMALFQYVIAPWLAALSAPFLMVVGLAIALKG